jgi:DICT domain-containing protein
MTFASIDDIAASWDLYERFLARLSASAPRGLVLQLAGPTDEGVRVIGVWKTERDYERFALDLLGPAIEAVEGPVAPVWATRRLHVVRAAIGMTPSDLSPRRTHHAEP